MRLILKILLASLNISVFLFAIACSNDPSTRERAEKARGLRQTQSIYQMLDEYPALASFFNNENLSVPDFEHRFFQEFLGNEECLSDMLDILDAMPPLFEPRQIPDEYFPADMPEETKNLMRSHGSLQDMLLALADLTDAFLLLPDEKKDPVYRFFNILSGSETDELFIDNSLRDYVLELFSLTASFFSGQPENEDLHEILGDSSTLLMGLRSTERPSADGIGTDFRRILFNTVGMLSDADQERLNSSAARLIATLSAMKTRTEGKFDFTDIDSFLLAHDIDETGERTNVEMLPDLLFSGIDLLQSDNVVGLAGYARDLLERDAGLGRTEVRDTVGDLLYGVGALLRTPGLNTLTQESLLSLKSNYSRDELKLLLDRIWAQGPAIGNQVAAMGISGYGLNHRQSTVLKQLLGQPVLLDSILRWVYTVSELGYPLDTFDDGMRDLVTHDPHMQPLQGNAPHYAPPQAAGPFSYRNLSWLRGLAKLASRYSQPLTPTSTFLYEKNGVIPADAAKQLIRTIMPDADRIPLGSFIWCDAYEKGEGHELGHGVLRREKRPNEYGMLVNDLDERGAVRLGADGKPLKKLITPYFPEIVTGAELAFYAWGECMYNGPFDNLYDNSNWLFTGKKFYVVIDLVQMLPLFKMKIPAELGFLSDIIKILGVLGGDQNEIAFGEWAASILKAFGIKSLPLKLWEATGANEIIYVEAGQIMNNLPAAITDGLLGTSFIKNSQILSALVAKITDMFGNIMPVGYRWNPTGKVYILPQDLRDLWPLLSSIGYFDPAAFHPDRLFNGPNHDLYAKCYDTTDYRYRLPDGSVNPAINKIAPLIGAACVGLYEPYRALVSQHPLSEMVTAGKSYFDVIAERQAAARAAFGGVVYPITYLINFCASLAESNTETGMYDDPRGDRQMPFLGSIEKLIAQDATGTIDNVLELLRILGSPDMEGNRTAMLQGLADMIASAPDTAEGPADALVGLMNLMENGAYVDFMGKACALGGKFLGEEYDIVPTLTGMLDPATGIMEKLVETLEYLSVNRITLEDVAENTGWLVELVKLSAQDRLFARLMLDVTTMLEQLQEVNAWHQIAAVTREGFDSDAVMSYVTLGLEKSPDYTWEELLTDLERFLRSDLMSSYEEGSLWRNVYYLTKFMAEAF